MKKYQINGSEFYEHFTQYDTWLEILDQLIEHEVIRRKKESGREFFRNVANDIIDGLVISEKCAASLLQDMSAALIQPPATYVGERIVPMPADLELLAKMSESDKTGWKRRIGNRTRKPLVKGFGRRSAGTRQGIGRQSAGVRQASGTTPAGTRQVSGTDWSIDNKEENAISDGRYYTPLNPTLLNYTQLESAKEICASHGDVSSTQVVGASQEVGGSREEQETGIAAGIQENVSFVESSHLGTRLNTGQFCQADNVLSIDAARRKASELDVNSPARVGAVHSIDLNGGIIVRVKNRTDGNADGELKITLKTRADNAVHTSYLSGTDERPFEPNKTRSPHLAGFAALACQLIDDGYGAPALSQGQFLLGQFMRWGGKSKGLVSLADHYAVLWVHPRQSVMWLFLVLGEHCQTVSLKRSNSYGTSKNLDLLAAAGNRKALVPITYSDELFYEFIGSVADERDRLHDMAASG
jgi:hypothetical protein